MIRVGNSIKHKWVKLSQFQDNRDDACTLYIGHYSQGKFLQKVVEFKYVSRPYSCFQVLFMAYFVFKDFLRESYPFSCVFQTYVKPYLRQV